MKYLAIQVALVVVVVSVVCAAVDEDDLATGRVKRQSLIPFPRVGRSRHIPLSLSRLPLDSLFWDLQLEGLREGKRQGLIPFPRVGKRQSLIPFPRVGRDPGQGFSDYGIQSERGNEGAEDLYGEFLPVQMTSNDPSKLIQN